MAILDRSTLQPYIELVRLDRPIAVGFLALPCYWGVALAKASFMATIGWFIVFGLGAIVMRSAGCAFNDWADADIDPYVKRTQSRPLATKALSHTQALLVFAIACLLGLAIWWQLPPLGRTFSIVALILAVAYPFSKRFMRWPQVVLGLAFNSGVLVAWATIQPRFTTLIACLLLYTAGVFWTLAYDTIYAFPDRKYDQELGMNSLALSWEPQDLKKNILLFYWISFSCLMAAGLVANLRMYYYLLILGVINFMLWRLYQLNLDDDADCLRFFKINIILGIAVFFGIMISTR
ncbi:MAG: 4-hydroxybenzoate octaprenyltransferase [Alphaproteobacteria bacterium]